MIRRSAHAPGARLLRRILIGACAVAATALLGAAPAAAQSGGCRTGGVSEGPGGLLQRVRFDGPMKAGQIAITYLAHSSFLIQSPEGVEIATDYGGWRPSPPEPDVATMDMLHEGHYELAPSADIGLILRSWEQAAGPQRHDVTVGDVRIRNVTTDVLYGQGASEKDGNSIFIFEIAGLCVAHLGHLYTIPTAEQFSQIGRIDIVFVAVNGEFMLDPSGLREVVERMGARVVIPMHAFSEEGASAFISVMAPSYAPVIGRSTELFSRDDLPSQPIVLLMPPEQ